MGKAPRAPEGKEPPPVPEPEKKPLFDLGGRDPRDFNAAMHFVGDFTAFVRDIDEYDVKAVAGGLNICASKVQGALAKL